MKNKRAKHLRGQLSAEMLLLLVVILAIVAIVASNALSSGKKVSSGISEQSYQAFRTVMAGACIEDGYGPCETGEDCCSGYCDESTKTCG